VNEDNKESIKIENTEALKALNERLGITDRDSLFNSHELKSVNELIENSRREFEKFSKEISSEKRKVEENEKRMVSSVSEIKDSGNSSEYAIESINDFEKSLVSLQSLVSRGESIIRKLYDAIDQTDLVDPDIIEATAKIIESVRISISDIINYNISKFQLEFQYKRDVEMENLKQRNKISLEERKSELRMKENEHKQKLKEESDRLKAISAEGGEISSGDINTQTWNQSQMMDMMRNIINNSKNS